MLAHQLAHFACGGQPFIQPVELNAQRIELQAKNVTRNSIGEELVTWATYATVWAIPFDTVPISLFMLGYLFGLAYLAAGLTYWIAVACGLG